MKKPTLKRGRMNGHKVRASEGPWAGEYVFIPVGGTMVFNLGPYRGRYDHNGEWRDVRPT